MYLAASAAKYCEKGWGSLQNGQGLIGKPILGLLTFWIFVEFQAVIKAGGRRPRGTPLELPSLDLGFLEAALAADLITA